MGKKNEGSGKGITKGKSSEEMVLERRAIKARQRQLAQAKALHNRRTGNDGPSILEAARLDRIKRSRYLAWLDREFDQLDRQLHKSGMVLVSRPGNNEDEDDFQYYSERVELVRKWAKDRRLPYQETDKGFMVGRRRSA